MDQNNDVDDQRAAAAAGDVDDDTEDVSADVNNDASSDDDDDDGVEVIGEDRDYYDDDADMEAADAASGEGDSHITVDLIYMLLDSPH